MYTTMLLYKTLVSFTMRVIVVLWLTSVLTTIGMFSFKIWAVMMLEQSAIVYT